MAEQNHSGTVQIAVVGAGSFGRNHLRVYRALEQEGVDVRLAACVDASPETQARVAAEYGIPVFATVDELLQSGLKIRAASVCTPTVHHAAVAVALLSHGIDVLVEKPIAASLAEADEILSVAAQHQRIVQVGHLERFNPAVTAAMSLVNRPMFFESHRLSIFTPRSLDVDVVLDLMIHDLDIVLALANSPVREVRAVGLPVLSHKTDIANVRVEFASGAVANFTASRISTERVRKLRFFQPHQYLSLDFARQDLLMIDVTAASSLTPAQLQALFAASNGDESHSSAEVAEHLAGLRASQGQQNVVAQEPSVLAQPAPTALLPAQSVDAQAVAAQQAAAAQAHPSAGLSMRKIPTEPGEPLRLEIEDFLNAVRTRQQPRVSGSAGRNALALALEIHHAIEEHQQRAGLV